MTKRFALIVGIFLVLVGMTNFLIKEPDMLRVTVGHAILNVSLGVIGVLAARSRIAHRTYTLWVGIAGVILAALGFLGIRALIPNVIDLPTVWNYVHAVLGIAGLIVSFGSQKTMTPAAPGNPPGLP